MFDDKIRPIKEAILIPLSKSLGRVISPNAMTVISFMSGIVSVVFILRSEYIAAMIFWCLNRITDGLDGTIARITSRQSDLGGYIDIMVDFVIYFLIPLAFVTSRGLQRSELILLALLLGVFYINSASWMYLSAIIEKRGRLDSRVMTSINMPLGLIEGFETIVIYTLFFFIPDYLSILMIIMGCLTLIGAIQRVIWAIVKL